MTRKLFRRQLEDLACRAQLIDPALSAEVFALLAARRRHTKVTSGRTSFLSPARPSDRDEHRYLAYQATRRGVPSIPIEVWTQLTASGETDCHRSFDDYRESRTEAGLPALNLREFAPLWLQARRERWQGARIQEALREAEALAGIGDQAAG